MLEALSRIVATVQTVEKLAERVEKLENRPELQHAGTWKESKSYQSGSLCTHHSSIETVDCKPLIRHPNRRSWQRLSMAWNWWPRPSHLEEDFVA